MSQSADSLDKNVVESPDRRLLREILCGMPAPEQVARIREALAEPEPLFCTDPIGCIQGQPCLRTSPSAKRTSDDDSPEAVEKRMEEWAALNRAVDDYMGGYEFRGEDEHGREGCYTPTEAEKNVMRDCVEGLLADDDFIRAIAKVYPIRSQFSVASHERTPDESVEWCKSAEFGCECGRKDTDPCPLPHPRWLRSSLDKPPTVACSMGGGCAHSIKCKSQGHCEYAPHRWTPLQGEFPHCLECGIVRRADSQNGPCKGRAKIVPRTSPSTQRTSGQPVSIDSLVEEVTGLCNCHESYSSRDRIDPQCCPHNCGAAIKEAIERAVRERTSTSATALKGKP